ncbi:DUF6134 family protein [Woeseia oceani]|uniref:DUF3108 domain-containing protein n=1 Tax=Woeseia oceani TaxID=1548547 RepID=A0A193LFA2_9GAMM|nr:DUF6134 family protein [Woeseia oceani]ANO51210.1 hypothetical protein BA177_08345 [Woeseia oceani]
MVLLLRICVSLLLVAGWQHTALANESERWEFRVSLDGSVIGTHQFQLDEYGESLQLTSMATFDIKFMFFTAYRYRHENSETWADGCLDEIQARTVTNGRTEKVIGEREQGAFVVENDGVQTRLPNCVMSFAYWNPDFLQQPRLLNPQTGEYLDVSVTSLPNATLQVRGERQQARHYRLTAKGVDVELWYSQEGEWLALQSIAGGDRVIRYELI